MRVAWSARLDQVKPYIVTSTEQELKALSHRQNSGSGARTTHIAVGPLRNPSATLRTSTPDDAATSATDEPVIGTQSALDDSEGGKLVSRWLRGPVSAAASTEQGSCGQPERLGKMAWPEGKIEVPDKAGTQRRFLQRLVDKQAAGKATMSADQIAAAREEGLLPPPAGETTASDAAGASNDHRARMARAQEICRRQGIKASKKKKVLVIFSPHDSGLPSLIRDGGGLEVATLDWKDDPVLQDCQNATLMNRVLSQIRSNEWAFVVLENECKSFSIGKDGHIRPLDEPEGRSDLEMRQKVEAARHNRMAMFSAAVIRACHAANVDFLLETPAARHDVTSPAFWEQFADHASLLDLQCMKDVIEDLGLAVIIVAQCMMGSPFQKYTALLVPGRLKVLATEIFGHARECTCMFHRKVARGRDEQGRSLSEMAAAYPPEMNRAILELIERSIATKPVSFSDFLHIGSSRPHEVDGAATQVHREEWAPSGSLRQLEPEDDEVLLREPLPRHNVPNVTDPVDPPEAPKHVPGPFTTEQLIPKPAFDGTVNFQSKTEHCVKRCNEKEGWKAARAIRPTPIGFTEDEALNPPARGFSYLQKSDDLWHAVLPSTPDNPPPMKLKFKNFAEMAKKHGLKDNRTLSYLSHGYPSSPKLPLATVLVAPHVGGLQHMADLEKCIDKDVKQGYYTQHGKFPKRWPIIVQPMNIVVQHGNPRATIDCTIVVDKRIGSFNSMVELDAFMKGFRVKLLRVWQFCRGAAIFIAACRHSMASKFKIMKADFRGFFRRHGLQELHKYQNGRLLREFLCDDNLNFGGRLAPDLTGNESNACCFFARSEMRRLDQEYPTRDDVLVRFIEYRKQLAKAHGEEDDPDFVWWVLFMLYFYVDDGLAGVTADKLYARDGKPVIVLVTQNDGQLVKVHQERSDMYFDMIIQLFNWLGHETPEDKISRPGRQMVGLGTAVNLDTARRRLDEEKRVRYLTALREVRAGRGVLENGLVVTDFDPFNKLVHKLLHAADSRPLGRQYLFYCRAALRATNRLSPPAAIITNEASVELEWWEAELQIEDHVGLPLASRQHFPAVSAAGMLVIYSDSSREDTENGSSSTAMATEDSESESTQPFEPEDLDDEEEPEGSGLGAYSVINGVFFYIHDVWKEWELRAFSINVTELATEHMASLTFADLHPSATHISSFVDNTSAEFVSERGRPGKDSLGMHHINKQRQKDLTDRSLHQKTSRVTSKENQIADYLSRGRIKAALRFAREAKLVTIRVPIPPQYRDMSDVPRTWA